MQKIRTQADERRDITGRDQFGRAWSYQIEVKTGYPSGQITQAGWNDPLRTPQKYITMPKDEFGQPALGRLIVNMDRWIEEQAAAENEWRVRLWENGRDIQKNAFNPRTAEQDEYLLHLTGPKPWPSAAALLAARAGNQELLGKVPLGPEGRRLLGIVTVDDLAQEMGFDPHPSEPVTVGRYESYPEFLKAMKGKGMTIKDLAVAWHQHRAQYVPSANTE